MPVIKLETVIQSSIDICFDLSRSIDLHQISTAHTQEKAIKGKTSGLINIDEFVTWQATHFGIKQQLTSKITAFDRPSHFRDEQVNGAFKFIIHDHYFKQKNNEVIMTDNFNFQSPFGLIGKIVDAIVMTSYLKKLLEKRNVVIKDFAETGKWKEVLK